MESRVGVCAAVILTLVVGGGRAQLDVCGVAPARNNTKIVGGSDSASGSWPWMVSLRTSSSACGGTLITNEWILSAAHCWSSRPSDVTVYLGRLSLQGSDPNGVSRSVSQIITHPNYNDNSLDNDIALLKLSSSVQFTDYVRPVCLAAKGSAFSAGSSTWVTGWGRINTDENLPSPQRLQEVEVPILSNAVCKSFFKEFTDNMICGGREGKGICFGDSGGPMVVERRERWIQIGVNSFTTEQGCAIRNNPEGYARVSPYQTWIEEQISSDRPGFVFSSSNVVSRRYAFPLLLLAILHLALYL